MNNFKKEIEMLSIFLYYLPCCANAISMVSEPVPIISNKAFPASVNKRLYTQTC